MRPTESKIQVYTPHSLCNSMCKVSSPINTNVSVATERQVNCLFSLCLTTYYLTLLFIVFSFYSLWISSWIQWVGITRVKTLVRDPWILWVSLISSFLTYYEENTHFFFHTNLLHGLLESGRIYQIVYKYHNKLSLGPITEFDKCIYSLYFWVGFLLLLSLLFLGVVFSWCPIFPGYCVKLLLN